MNLSIEFHDGPLEAMAPRTFEEAGAVVQFEGVIRPIEAGRTIVAMEYEAYRPMADDTLRAIAAQIGEEFAIDELHMQHSVGRVPVGERSFRLVIAARHREPALRAMAVFIDRMKRDAPIWKRPQFADAPQPCA